MWLLPVLIAAAVGLLFYLRWFLRRVETARVARPSPPASGAATLGASDVVGHTAHEAGWSVVNTDHH